MAQLPPVLVWGVTASVVPLEPVPELDVADDDELAELEELVELVSDDVVSSDVDAETCLVVAFVELVSLHAMAPPNDNAATTLSAAAARRARRARGFLRSGAIGVPPSRFSIWTDRTDPG